MNNKMRVAQKKVLSLFSKEARNFALAGGTALELYYLRHRFSWDLDFFSPKYDLSEIERLMSILKKHADKIPTLESDLTAPNRARVRFYTVPVKGVDRPLKIDFVEDVLFEKPSIEKKDGVRVYSAENIYLQKIAAISGMQPSIDAVGRTIRQGRGEARDVFDLYMLSATIRPLHEFLRDVSPIYQKGIVHWYRTFSRQELKLALLDLEIYDQRFNSREMIAALETEIRQFVKEVLEE